MFCSTKTLLITVGKCCASENIPITIYVIRLKLNVLNSKEDICLA
jgi:hypothetical protein